MPITITEVTLAVVRLDLVHEFETSSHRKNHLDHIVLRVTATDGSRRLVGWGECASPSDPFYCGETTETCWQILGEYLVPMLLGRSWSAPDEASRMTAKVSGNHFAKAGLDMACWDLFAQSQGLPLADLLGPQTADRVVAGVSLGIEPSLDALLEQVDRHVCDGYRRVKLKIRPGWDVEPVRAVRAAFPRLALQVDANAAYTLSDLDAARRAGPLRPADGRAAVRHRRPARPRRPRAAIWPLPSAWTSRSPRSPYCARH